MSYFYSSFVTSRQRASLGHSHIQTLICRSVAARGNPEQTQLTDYCQGSQSPNLITAASHPVGSRIFCVSGKVRSLMRRVEKKKKAKQTSLTKIAFGTVTQFYKLLFEYPFRKKGWSAFMSTAAILQRTSSCYCSIADFSLSEWTDSNI